MADAWDVITVDQARAGLNLKPADAGVDSGELGRLVTVASRMIDDRCGPVVTRAATVEAEGGGRFVWLPGPVSAVGSVIEWPSGITITEEDRDAPTANDWRLGDWGRLERRAGGAPAVWDTEVTVEYTAGRFATTGDVDGRFVAACQMVVAHLWRAERGAGVQTWGATDGWSPGGVTATGVPTFGMPRAVLDILGSEVRPPAVA